MSILEIRDKVLRGFFMIYSGMHIGLLAFMAFVARRGVLLSDLLGLFVLALLHCLLYFVFYSRRELTGKRMFTRIGIHYLLNLVLIFSGATYFRWVIWGNFDLDHPILIFALFTIIYIVIAYLELREVRVLADELNKKLQKRKRNKVK